jgi:Fe-Mn family superoxide dismutase
MTHKLPSLSYPFNALEPHIDALTMEIHHDKHHAAYVKNLNAAIDGNAELKSKTDGDLIENLSAVPEGIRNAVRNNAGGHVNHTLFWETMNPGGTSVPTDKLAEAINATFGSFDDFKVKFEAAGVGRFGSGWVWLLVNDRKLEITSTANQDNPTMGKAVSGCDGSPILGNDVWEHAYYLHYQNRRPDYLKAWWNVVNWDVVAERYDAAV